MSNNILCERVRRNTIRVFHARSQLTFIHRSDAQRLFSNSEARLMAGQRASANPNFVRSRFHSSLQVHVVEAQFAHWLLHTGHGIADVKLRDLGPGDRTQARVITDPRYGSSPFDSTMRPHRGSRAMSTIGENTQSIPSVRASSAPVRATVSAAFGSQLAAIASGMENMVRCP